MAKQEKRVEALEEKEDHFDMQSLEGKETISMKDIVELMRGFQADVMNKCLSHSDLNEVNEHINHLQQRIDGNAAQIKINTEIKESIVEVSNMPKKTQEISLNVLRLEH